MKAVCDSSTLIGLAKIGKVGLLKELFDTVYLPQAVWDEVVGKGKKRPGAKEISESSWLVKHQVKDRRMVELLTAELGRGEAEVLVLGKEIEADWLILDDERARAAATAADFDIIGLAGILLTAKERKLIPSIKPLLDELLSKNFRLSRKVYDVIVKKAKEE